jgi:hypothetical protein
MVIVGLLVVFRTLFALVASGPPSAARLLVSLGVGLAAGLIATVATERRRR